MGIYRQDISDNGLGVIRLPQDCVNEAIENNALPWLAPGEEVRWSLGVELQT